MFELEELFRDHAQTQFVVVTIPTNLAVAESKRLVSALQQQDVLVEKVIVNQVFDGENTKQDYVKRLASSQQKHLAEIEGVANNAGVQVVKIPYFDSEVQTIYGLRAMGQMIMK
uniref:ArsA/GET3 Anion-transporting ATPase-like domain-containing protein n=1 Tax=Fibrocapsa japonica TaxID=94617 RepID=A0A7S2V1X9_9STRA